LKEDKIKFNEEDFGSFAAKENKEMQNNNDSNDY
jgi:hypothetical protein